MTARAHKRDKRGRTDHWIEQRQQQKAPRSQLDEPRPGPVTATSSSAFSASDSLWTLTREALFL